MRLSAIVILLATASALFAQTCVPEFWHTYDEIVAQMMAWEQEFPQVCYVESIGVTNGAAYQEPLTLYGMRMSDNAQVDQDRPAILFVGQCHAEEITGIEVVLFYIQRLLASQTTWPYSDFLGNLEIWFVPTMNPEGLHVVMFEDDVSFRKNKRDNNNNGIFDHDSIIGGDIDGVDLNRNYDFGWVHGDSLGSTNGEENYDYYRGPYPFSEGETAAIAALGRREKFVYSINFHDSRTGFFSEKVFVPWEFAGLASRRAPDYDIAMTIGQAVAQEIDVVGTSGTYEYSASQGRIGKSTQWFYAALNTFQLTIEVSGNQPDSSGMFEIVLNNHNGMNWLLKRALDGVVDVSPMLRGRVIDANTQQPLVAEVIIEERTSPYFEPRYTDEPFGRFFRVLPQGTYTLTVKKEGYNTHTQSVVCNPSGWSADYLIALEPSQSAHYTGMLTSEGENISGEIVMTGQHGSESFIIENGVIDLTIWEGLYKMEVWSSGHTRMMQDIIAAPGEHDLDIDLDIATQLLFESFDDANDCAFTLDGPWAFIDSIAHEGMAITDSWGGYGFYEPGADVNIATTEPLTIPANAEVATIEWWEHVYTEPVFDPCTVEVSLDNTEWTTIYEVSGKIDEWNRRLVSLDDYIGETIYIRFHLTDDGEDATKRRLVDPGWTIDDVLVSWGAGEITDVNDDTQTPAFTRLHTNYPNPFNPDTTFRFTLGGQVREAEIRVYNIRGELVDVLPLNEQARANGELTWNAAGQASGVYLYRLRVDGVDYATRKACLLK